MYSSALSGLSWAPTHHASSQQGHTAVAPSLLSGSGPPIRLPPLSWPCHPSLSHICPSWAPWVYPWSHQSILGPTGPIPVLTGLA